MVIGGKAVCSFSSFWSELYCETTDRSVEEPATSTRMTLGGKSCEPMKPAPFSYFSPRSIGEVLELLAQYGPDARVLAGGQSLVPLINLRMARPDVLIDLSHCDDLKKIEHTGSGIRYGAMIRQYDAQLAKVTREHCPLVSMALAHAGPVAVRNRATVGGTLAHADRSAELPGVAVAMNATLVIESHSGTREVRADQFFRGDMTTCIEAHELLRSVTFPATDHSCFCHFLEVGLRQEGVAIAGIAALIRFDDGGTVKDPRFAVVGVEAAPVRLKALESELVGRALTPAIIAGARNLGGQELDPAADAHASASYRRRLTASLVEEALERALQWRRHELQ